MDNELLKEMILNKEVKDADLSNQVLDGIDFSGCTLERVNFKKAELRGCRFRGATLRWCDLRYVTIEHGTFEDATIDFCDLYRAMVDGIVIFNGCQISNSSLNKTYFGDSALPKRNNLVDGKLLQQDYKAYETFLTQWHTMGTGERLNDVGKHSDWSPKEALATRWADAETIFKNFSAQWTGRGYIADGNWGYVLGRRMERNRMAAEMTQHIGCGKKLKQCWKLLTNVLSDLFFGYGESMTKMIITYVVVVFLFAWGFSNEVSLLEYGQALSVSLKNMAGMDSDILRDVSPFVDMLNVVQTTVGIILTGIFGFILGNKIRNQ